jgi:hypothetical protein
VQIETPTDPDEVLCEQLRSASVQVSPALDKIQGAHDSAKQLSNSHGIPHELGDALSDALGSLDDAGRTLTEGIPAPPDLATLKKDLKKYRDLRQSEIDACNDALHDLDDAAGSLDSASSDAPGKFQNPIEGVEGPIDEATAIVKDTLTALGGKEVQDDDPPSGQ